VVVGSIRCVRLCVFGWSSRLFDAPVVLRTAEGEVVDVGLAAVGPITDRVMDLAVGPGHGTAGAATATFPGKTVSTVYRF
jgi:hypothetical protein